MAGAPAVPRSGAALILNEGGFGNAADARRCMRSRDDACTSRFTGTGRRAVSSTVTVAARTLQRFVTALVRRRQGHRHGAAVRPVNASPTPAPPTIPTPAPTPPGCTRWPAPRGLRPRQHRQPHQQLPRLAARLPRLRGPVRHRLARRRTRLHPAPQPRHRPRRRRRCRQRERLQAAAPALRHRSQLAGLLADPAQLNENTPVQNNGLNRTPACLAGELGELGLLLCPSMATGDTPGEQGTTSASGAENDGIDKLAALAAQEAANQQTKAPIGS